VHDVFLSYAHEDRAKVGAIVAALLAEGLSVFWDKEIHPGKPFRDVIQAELRSSRCVVVLWSVAAVSSRWVPDEADEAINSRLPLVPAKLDGASIPLGFRGIHACDLSKWAPGTKHALLVSLVNAVKSSIAQFSPSTLRPAEAEYFRARPVPLALDTLEFAVRHGGSAVINREARRRGADLPETSISLSAVLTNVTRSGVVLVPVLEVQILDRFPVMGSTFPNDAEERAFINLAESVVDLEEPGALLNVLSAPLHLAPQEATGVLLHFQGQANNGYVVRLRASFKLAGFGRIQSLFTGRFALSYATRQTSWRSEVSKAIKQGKTVEVRLARGWHDFNSFLEHQEIRSTQIIRHAIDTWSDLEECLILGTDAVIFPALPPLDRALEASHDERGGVLARSSDLAHRFRVACVEGSNPQLSRLADAMPPLHA
jgi:TIR domain-containing protein